MICVASESRRNCLGNPDKEPDGVELFIEPGDIDHSEGFRDRGRFLKKWNGLNYSFDSYRIIMNSRIYISFG